MGTNTKVLGFVPIQAVPGGFAHLTGHTIRMRWPGTAETWLDGLVRTGHYVRWRPADVEGDPADYRGARVFRCVRARRVEEEEAPEQLVAVWEGRL